MNASLFRNSSKAWLYLAASQQTRFDSHFSSGDSGTNESRLIRGNHKMINPHGIAFLGVQSDKLSPPKQRLPGRRRTGQSI